VHGHYFVSYSRVDGGHFARRLADQLTAGPPSYPAWLDVRDIRPGQQWDDQIAEAIQTSRGLLFVMTPDSVGSTSGCKPEWGWALKHKIPVIPLQVDPEPDPPFQLQWRQYIDFTGGFDAALAQLRLYLGDADSPLDGPVKGPRLKKRPFIRWVAGRPLCSGSAGHRD
jgi:TIR domain